MRMVRVLLLLTGILAAAAFAQDEAAKKEIERLRGTWKFVSIEIEGVKAQPEQFKDARMVLQGDQFTMTQGPITYKGTFKVDLTQKPKHLDIHFSDGPEKGKTSLGIYELEGDTWKLCLGLAGKDRPKEFVSKPGSGHVVEVLQRGKSLKREPGGPAVLAGPTASMYSSPGRRTSWLEK